MSAVASLSASLPQYDTTQAEQVIEGSIALTGNYGTGGSHGDTLDLSLLGAQSSQLPIRVDIFEKSPSGAAPSGNIYRYMYGTTQANGSLSVFQGNGTEYTQGSAYGTPPFAVTGFALGFRAYFPTYL